MFTKLVNSSLSIINSPLKLVLFSNTVPKHEKQRRQRSKKKQTLEDVLREVNKNHVKIDKEERKKNNTILYSVLEKFLKKMKSCDNLFNSLKPRLEYLGSYFDGLRVGHATEYDINIILTLHLNYDKIKLNGDDKQGAYATLNMPSEFRRLSKTPATAKKGFKDTELWCDPNHCLSVQRFRSWMQRVVDATLNTLSVENGTKVIKIDNKTYQISAKTSGPANTLSIIENSDNVIDVDLVPTLEFRYPKIPTNCGINFNKVKKTNIEQYFVVPKPSADDFSWRLAFPFQERFYVYNKHNMKSTIKILKLLRDVQGFNKLASYYIKTIFLWEAVENTDDFWKNNSLSFLVVYMMRKLKECLENRIIKNFWCPNHNLIENIKSETCQNWANRLSYIINVIEEKKKTDPHVILKFLTAHKNDNRIERNL